MRRIADYVRATNPYERALVKTGVPAEYWNTNFAHLQFSTCTANKVKVTPTQQRNGLKQVWTNPDTQFVVLASELEEEALRAACFVLMQLQKISVSYKIMTSDQLWRVDKMSADDIKHTRAIAIHNVLAPHMPGARYVALRDTLWHSRYRVRLLVVTGTKDPYTFSVKQLGLRPTICCYFKDTL